MKHFYQTIFFILFTFFSSPAQIQVTADVKVALNKAIEKDSEFTNQKLELQKAELKRKSILSKYIPKVEFTGAYAYINSQANVDLPTLQLPILPLQLFNGTFDFSFKTNVLHAGITAKAILFSGGQIYNGAKALKEKNQATKYLMESQKDKIIKDLLESLDKLKLLQSAKTLISDSQKRLNTEKNRLEKAISLGLAIPYDRDKIKLATLELHSKKEDLESKEKLLLLKIAQITDYTTDEIKKIKHQVEPILIPDTLTTNNRNEIKALESFKRASEFALRKERGSLLPNLGAFANMNYTSLYNTNSSFHSNKLHKDINVPMNHLNLYPNFLLGVVLKWEIFSGFERHHKIKEAKISLKQVENKLSDAKEKMQLQLQKNTIEYEHQLNQVAIAQQRELIANNNNKSAQKQYKEGLIGISERLASENDIYKESVNKIQSIINQRKAAIEAYNAAGALSNFIKSN